MQAPAIERFPSVDTQSSHWSQTSSNPFGEIRSRIPGRHNPPLPQTVGSSETKSAPLTSLRQSSIDSVASHYSMEGEEDDPYEMTYFPKQEGYHPNKMSTKIQRLFRGHKVRTAQQNDLFFEDVEQVLKDLDDCIAENNRLKAENQNLRTNSKGGRKKKKTRKKRRKRKKRKKRKKHTKKK